MRRHTLPVWTLSAALLLGGCTGSVYDLPLPGGADVGDDPYEVTVELANALDLVPHNGVRVNDVPVGTITDVSLAPSTWTARVRVRLGGDVRLPANATARLVQTSLLGEKYIAIEPPADEAARGTLRPGDTIPVTRTSRNPEVEEILGALSLLLNGGGVEQLHTIAAELNTALSGNEDAARGVLENLARVTTSLDSQRENIRASIDGLAALSGRLAGQRTQISNALVNVQPGLQVLVDQRQQLVDMLGALDHLAQVAGDTIGASREDLVEDLRLLAPTLEQLAASGSSLAGSLQVAGTFPFSDYALSVFHGDYGNLNATVNIDAAELLNSLTTTDNPLITLLGLPVTPPNVGDATTPAPQDPGPPVAPPLGDFSTPGPTGGITSLLGALLGGPA